MIVFNRKDGVVMQDVKNFRVEIAGVEFRIEENNQGNMVITKVEGNISIKPCVANVIEIN